MPQLVRVKIIAEGKFDTVVDYLGVKYQVKSYNLSNYITQSTEGGFVTYAYINSIFLTRRWK